MSRESDGGESQRGRSDPLTDRQQLSLGVLIVSASALTGHTRIHNDRVVTPLIYSTEVARSMKVGRVLEVADESSGVRLTPGSDARIEYEETGAGDLRARKGSRNLGGSYVVSGVVYGLVNVRTNGNRILCATLNEKSQHLRREVVRFPVLI